MYSQTECEKYGHTWAEYGDGSWKRCVVCLAVERPTWWKEIRDD